MKLAEKAAIVTGGTRGIGAALVKKLAAEGAGVLFSYVSSLQRAAEIEKSVRADGGRAVAMRADVRDRAAMENLAAKAVEAFGRLDIAINNAHQAYAAKWFEESSWEDFQRELDTLVKGPFNIVQSCLPQMKRQGGGVIINVGSTMALAPRPRHSFYITAKNALTGLTEALAIELGQHGIRVNLVTPGPLATEHNAAYPPEVMQRLAEETPLRHRLATVDEVAAAIVMMTYDEAACVTGANVLASAGFAIA